MDYSRLNVVYCLYLLKNGVWQAGVVTVQLRCLTLRGDRNNTQAPVLQRSVSSLATDEFFQMAGNGLSGSSSAGHAVMRATYRSTAVPLSGALMPFLMSMGVVLQSTGRLTLH